MDASIVTALISFVLGTVLGAYLKIRWERINSAQLQKQEYKTERYKTVILLMYSLLDFDKQIAILAAHGRTYKTVDGLVEELTAEWNNMLLYASDDVLISAQAFIKHPDKSTFRRCVFDMRKDLWGGKVSSDLDNVTI